jgi:SAM-dependent methyltransferase
MSTTKTPTMDVSAFLCLGCRSPLKETDQTLECPACGKSWPVRDGIPHFFEPSYYWGEVSSDEAAKMIQSARQEGWHRTVLEKFGNDPDSRIALLDWQRTSWLPLLALKPDCLALDIGCGYGAITHFLSRGVKQLYSLEAIPHRIEFTRIRLEQENVDNVQLVQASGLHPPFRDGLFDLIVVNGVLEWLGEWVEEGDPRDVQVGFLKEMGRLLKPDGLLYIGIESRIGLDAFRGVPDHSSLPYTSLMPRRVASWYLRHKKYQHSRTELNKKRQYRTYTYGERGYRKLLTAGGFPATFFYWATPGYNQPYALVPVEDSLLLEYLQGAEAEPRPNARRNWKKSAGRLLLRTPIGRRLCCSEFVILAAKNPSVPLPGLWKFLRQELPDLPDLKNPLPALQTVSFHWKNIIRVFESGETTPRCILKSSTSGLERRDALEESYKNLVLAHEVVSQAPGCGFTVPRPLGFLRREPFCYAAESAIEGSSLARLVFPARDPARSLAAHLPRAVECAIAIAKTMCGERRAAPMNPSWVDVPAQFQSYASIQKALAEHADSDWVHHADLSVENVLIAGDRIGVIDWEHLFRGGPALYDLFTLLLSVLPAIPVAEAAGVDPWLNRFEEAFFGKGKWTGYFSKWIRQAATSLEVPSNKIWSQFVKTLLIRFHYMLPRAPSQVAFHSDFLRIADGNAGRFLGGV